MKVETAFSEAFKRAGVDPNETQLARDISRYLGAGGTFVRLRELIEELAGEDLLKDGSAPKSSLSTPAKPIASGEGRPYGANGRNLPARPAREPSAVQTAAVERRKQKSALTVFDKYCTRTGQAWGNVRPIEYASFTQDAKIVRELELAHGRLDRAAKLKPLRELLTPQQMYAVLRKAGVLDRAA